MAFTAEDVKMIQDLGAGRTPATPAPAAPEPPAVETPATPPPTTIPPINTGTPPPPTETTTPEPDEYLDLASLGVESLNDLHERLNKISEYERQLSELNEYKAGPKFASERQKFLYDYANKFEGMELSAARQLLEVVELDLKTLPDQQIRYEAFKLNPQNKGLSQDEIYKLFMHDEVQRFGSPDDESNPQSDVQKIIARQATAKAREELAKVQNEWNASRTEVKTPDQLAQERLEYQQFLTEQMSGFDGIQLKLQAQDEKGEKLEGSLNFKLDPATQTRAVMEALADPAGWWDRKMEALGIMSANQQVPDFKKFGELVTRIEFMEDLLNKSYQQGGDDRLAQQIKAARNVADPSRPHGTIVPPSTLSEKQEANREAMKMIGIV